MASDAQSAEFLKPRQCSRLVLNLLHLGRNSPPIGQERRSLGEPDTTRPVGVLTSGPHFELDSYPFSRYITRVDIGERARGS